ncbi:BapA/Bap/LapF family large adhesin [Guyparkeria sp.]|uniref:BapA/Bap/LapF family large adhesin n=1 Tax=Guyparkeria sp. TaxID=2035736 RepID=UPI0039710E91
MSNLENVLVTDKETGQVSEVDLSALKNTTNSVITLAVGPDDIASIEARSGDLVLTLKSGETIVFEGFFDPEEAERNELVLEDSDGILWWGQYDSPWSEFWFAEINADKLAADEEGFPWWLVAAGLGGAALAAAAGGGGSSSGGTSPGPEPTAPDAPTAEFNEAGDAVSGEAEPGSTVTVYDEDGSELGSTTADEDGNYTVELDEPLTNGEEVEVTATDEDGNESDPTTAVAPDPTAPDAPIAVAPDTTAPDAPTAEFNDTGDEVSGEAEPGSTVTVYDEDGNELGSTTADEDGNYTVELDEPLTNGEEVEVTATDEAGNESEPTTATAPDTTAPDAPTLELANDTGDVDGVTSDGTVNVGGLEENATWEYSTDGGASWTEGEGTSFVLPEGDYAEGDVLARQTDEAGNTSDNGELGAVSVDTTSPGGEDGTDAPVLAIAEADNGFINAEELADGIQAVVTLTEGTQEGDTVTVTLSDADGTEHVFTHTVTADDIVAGEAALTLDGDFAEGAASAVAVITDEAGNSSADSNSVAFEIDTVAPEAPALELANDPGDVDGVTSDGTVNVGGLEELEENATWEYSTDGGASWTEGEGTSFVLPEGDYADGDVLARQTDEAGNTSDNGELGAVSVDTTAPDAPVITGAVDDVDPSGALADGDSSNDSTPTLEGTVEADSTVTLFQDGTEIGTTTADAGGNWSFEVPALADDTFVFTATATDAAGNVSADSAGFTLTIDTVAPDAPTLELVNDTGDVDGVTSDGTVSVGGLEENATWEYSTDGGASWTEGEGTSFVLPEGDYAEGDVLARQTDEAGNTSDNGELGAVSVDTTSPGGEDGTDAPVLAIAEADNGFINAEELADGIQAVVTLTEGTQEGDTVTVSLSDADGTEHVFTHTVTAAEATAGQVDMDLTGPFAEGDASAVAVITDEAGNSSADSNSVAFAIDTLSPVAPTLTLANDTGEDGDGVTSDGTVNVGDLEEGATWEYSTDGGDTWTEGEGTSFELPEGEYAEGDVLARQTDEAGNTSNNGELGAVTVDTTVPDAPTAEFNEVGDEVSGEADPGSTVTVYDEDDSVLGTAEADADTGEYTVVLDEPLTDGEEVTVSATDEAGNESAPTDATAPQAPPALSLTLANDTGTAGDGITSDGTVEVEGLVTGATWEYSTDGGTTWNEGTGESFELSVGEYADGDVIARQTVGALTSPENSLGAVEIVELNAVDDAAALDMGEQSVTVHPSETEEEVQVVGVAEGSWGTDASTSFTVSEDQVGDVAIQIQQTALVAVADAFRVEVYDEGGNLVYAGGTDDSLVGDVGGLEILGVTGDDTLTAVQSGLAPGEYSVVVRNEESALENLLVSDPDNSGLVLEELGDAGVVLGPDNQEAVLGEVESALNDYLLVEELGLGLGTVVRDILEPVLETTETIGAGELVGILTEPLDELGLTGELDVIVDTLAETLLSNTLTAFQFTDITTTVTEYGFATNAPVTGNVITGDAGEGEDELVPGSEVAQVQLLDAEGNPSGDPVMVPEGSSAEIAGLYGVLIIAADGSYSYVANGDRASVGESDTFAYTVSDGLNEATANLTIQIDGEALPDLNAQPDSIALDMGDQSAVVHEPQTDSNVSVLEADALIGSDPDAGVPLSVTDDNIGEVQIEVSQTNLVAVASGFVVEVLDDNGEVVFAAATDQNSPLLADVASIGVLGATGPNSLTTTVEGLESGNYTVVVRSDGSALESLLTGLSLQELGDQGFVLGAENQAVVLDTLESTLGPLVGPLLVHTVVEPLLDTVNGLGVDELVGVLTDALDVLGLTSLLDDVLDDVAAALVNNTLSVLEFTDITTTLTEYAFGGDLSFSGNVITGEGDGNVEDGIAQGGVVTQVENAEGDVVTVLGSGAEGVTIAGLYGVLTIFEDGSYTYDATGARAGLGQEESFTYAVTNGAFNPDGSRVTSEATLTIDIDGQGTAGDIAFAGVDYAFATEPGLNEDGFVSDSWLLGVTSRTATSDPFTVEPGTTQDVTLDLSSGDLLGLLDGTTISLQSRDAPDSDWETLQAFSADQLVGLLGLGGGGEFTIPGLQEGEYRLEVEVTGLSVAGGYSIDLTSTVTQLDDFVVDGTAPAEGNLLENDVERVDEAGNPLESTLSVSLDGITYESTESGEVELVGEYGTLVVQPNGDYTYTPQGDLENFVDTLSDTFTYQVAYDGGPTEEAELTVFVEPSNPANDLFVVDSATFDPIDGEGGFDVLLLDGGFDLDFTDPATASVENIERVDLGAEDGPNNLTLGSDEVIELTDDGDVLQITGDSEDTVTLSDGASWAEGASQAIHGVAYTEYTFGDATLLVQDGVNVEVS